MVKLSQTGLGRSDPITQYLALSSRIFRELVHTQAFQRLEQIRFLGAIDYLVIRAPNGAVGYERYTRYEHSVGVAWLALLYSEAEGLTSQDRDLLTAAALLHDIGHAPLSHSLEPVFFQEFDIEHHGATESIILGEVPLGRDVHAVLKRYSVDSDRLLSLIGGEDASFHCFMNGPINFDTIEGILRSLRYFDSTPSFPTPEAVLEAATRRSVEADQNIVDRFWLAKDYVYQYLINSREGIFADQICKVFFLENLKQHDRRSESRINTDDYYSTEAEIFRKLPGLRELLIDPNYDHLIASKLTDPIKFKHRRFYVDSSADFFSRDDSKRYKQTKESLVYSLKAPLTTEHEQDLFDGSHRKSSIPRRS
jgi:hypothetical protein